MLIFRTLLSLPLQIPFLSSPAPSPRISDLLALGRGQIVSTFAGSWGVTVPVVRGLRDPCSRIYLALQDQLIREAGQKHRSPSFTFQMKANYILLLSNHVYYNKK